jgi:hypothetical protein
VETESLFVRFSLFVLTVTVMVLHPSRGAILGITTLPRLVIAVEINIEEEIEALTLNEWR